MKISRFIFSTRYKGDQEVAFLPLEVSFPTYVNPALRVRRNVLMSMVGHLPMFRNTPNSVTFFINNILNQWPRLVEWFKTELRNSMEEVHVQVQTSFEIKSTMEETTVFSQKVALVSPVMVEPEVRSFSSAMVPLNAFESTNFLTTALNKAQENSDMREIQNLLFWQHRTRLTLQPILERELARLSSTKSPLLPKLRSLDRLVRTFPVGMGQIAHLVDGMSAATAQTSWQTEQAQWLRITEDVQQILFLSDHVHAPVYTQVLCNLRRQRLKRDNPQLTDDQINELLPDINLARDQPFGEILKEGISNQDSVAMAIKEITEDLDSANAALRSEWLSQLLASEDFSRLPDELVYRIKRHPFFSILSKEATFLQGENEFNFHHLAANKAQLILESTMLAPPTPREMSTAGYGATTPLFAQPSIEYDTSNCSLTQLRESFILIEMEKITPDVIMADQAVFQAHLVATFNVPEKATINEDFPKTPRWGNQDDPSEQNFSSFMDESLLTQLLDHIPEDLEGFIETWWKINSLCSTYRVLPIIFFRCEKDFLVFQSKMDFFQERPEQVNMVCVVPPTCNSRAIQHWGLLQNDVARMKHSWVDNLHRRKKLFKGLVQVNSDSRARFFSVTNITTESVAVSLLPTEFSLQAWCRGPWLQYFMARRMEIDSPTDALLRAVIKPGCHPYRVQRDNNPCVSPEPLRTRSQDFTAVRGALDVIRQEDPLAGDFLIQILNVIFPEGDEERRQDRQLWHTFHEYHDKIRFSDLRHASQPPDISTRPIPLVFSAGLQRNVVYTRKPSFVQSLMSDLWPIKSNDFSTFSVLLARILELQRSFRFTGQIPVTASPDLRFMMGLNPECLQARISMDWIKWHERETLRAETLDVFGSFDSLTSYMDWHDMVEINLINSSPERDTRGKFLHMPIYSVNMCVHLMSPLAAPCLYMEAWRCTASSQYSVSQGSVTYQSVLPQDWARYSGLHLTDLMKMEELIGTANQKLQDLQDSADSDDFSLDDIFLDTFFPLVQSNVGSDYNSPSVLWPTRQISLPYPTDVAIPTDERRVIEAPIFSPVSVLFLTDRLVVSETPVVDMSFLAIMLENPFSHLFRDDTRSQDIWIHRWERIRNFLAPPMSKDSNDPSIYKMPVSYLQKVQKWVDQIRRLSDEKGRVSSAIDDSNLAPELDLTIIQNPDILFKFHEEEELPYGTTIPRNQRIPRLDD